MTPRPLALGALVILLALLTPYPLATAQAPPPEVVYMALQIDGELFDFQCFQVIHTTPTEAIPPQEITPTQEAPPHTPQATLRPEATVTPTPIPSPATTPQSACVGFVMALEGLRVRATPNGVRIGLLGYGAYVDLFGYVWDTLGNKWYRVRWGSQWGYSHAEWVAPDPACWGLTED